MLAAVVGSFPESVQGFADNFELPLDRGFDEQIAGVLIKALAGNKALHEGGGTVQRSLRGAVERVDSRFRLRAWWKRC